MDKKLLKSAAIQSLALMLAVVTLSFAMERYRIILISAGNSSEDHIARAKELQQGEASHNNIGEDSGNSQAEEDNALAEELRDGGLIGLFEASNKEIIDRLGERFIIIKKPSGNNYGISLEDLYITKAIRLTLSGSGNFDSSFIGRQNSNSFFTDEPEYTEYETYHTTDDEAVETVINLDYGMDIVHGITINNRPLNATGEYEAEILLELDDVYVHTIEEDENYYYISLQEPAKVYERVLVIDAGHGGKDVGAISKDGQYEKDINLQLLLSLKELLDKEDIKVYYTRLSDDTVYLRPRVELANSVECDMFISIHCNSNNVSGPNGTEILYYDTSFGSINSYRLAQIFSDEISRAVPLIKRGLYLKKNDDIFILNNAAVPAVLIETGYLSNSYDLNYLLSEENRRAAASGIFNGIMKAYEEMDSINGGE